MFSPESREDSDFAAVRAAMDDYGRLLREVDEILRTAPDRIAAERMIVTKYADRIEQASKTEQAAYRVWLDKILQDTA